MSSTIGGIARTARPRQWLKNVLVFAAPLASARFLEASILLDSLLAFLAFCASASAVYFINDTLDVKADRAHPRKRNRPIAAGIVRIPAAIATAVILLLGGLGLALAGGWELLVVVAVYDTIQIAYCFWLKHQPILDIAVVSSGFLLRMIAGGAATGIELSQWFLLVAVFGSLLMVSGKRYAEILANPDLQGEVRGSLKGYSRTYLAFMWHTAATILVLGYSLWAFDPATGSVDLWLSISVAPFVLAVLRYTQHIDRGDAEAPEDIAIHDRMLQAFAAAWLVLVAVGIYLPS
ncbi:decaprenyl-phosphate phosphoribosyltransferase [Herbiconiux sp. L3-i23]|uniref:decaprenyl-phosphate phosphoribosyltransferase n=1 Tax=Herbiconiux sp. L3-i23 TaxID=2905871 RepID=UPI002056FF57|nr:decaprenyl-phosphate phosphoribosyltransferase [Herbiconiux sp. L3-i23]BDI21609.1 decaprenyl-phosphate phosphoribosyltransferase [Herbiconiux sp. L3-i23]